VERKHVEEPLPTTTATEGLTKQLPLTDESPVPVALAQVIPLSVVLEILPFVAPTIPILALPKLVVRIPDPIPEI
jgi:hypothetical protein